jgi:hypothetical protein
VLLLPANAPADLNTDQLPAWLVFTADDPEAHAGAWWQVHYQPWRYFDAEDHKLSRIAWANKPVFVFARRDAASR